MDDIQFKVTDADGWGRGGGESVSCPMTCVFFKLMVSPTEWAVTAASSAKKKSRRHLSWTLVLALSLERLKSFPSVLVQR